jgi:hypothetical protein
VNATPPHNPLWHAHLELLERIAPAARAETPGRTPRTFVGELEAAEALRGEWTAAPPGRLGRRLLADVEPYLEFFALARGR